MSDAAPASIRSGAPATAGAAAFIVASRGTTGEQWFPLSDRLEIGRDSAGAQPRPGLLLVPDATVSRSHCVLTCGAGRRWFVRDTSRNGTRLDGRRLVPNVEVELRSGQTISVGDHHQFVVVFEQGQDLGESSAGTVGVPSRAVVTVLVGDIRDYTELVRRAPSAALQQSVSHVFRVLTDSVTAHGGTVKEFQGDALVAFWEGTIAGAQAAIACRAALAADRVARELAADRSVWQLEDFPLRMDWALASGPVLIDSFGGRRPAGLSMIGEAPVLAFRIEKFATDHTGRILVCPTTRAMANQVFNFRDLGLMQAKGFDRPDHVFALEVQSTGSPSHGVLACG